MWCLTAALWRAPKMCIRDRLDALGGMQDGNVFDMSHLTLRLLGKEGRKKLYDHLRTPDGRVPVAKVADALGELMNRCV